MAKAKAVTLQEDAQRKLQLSEIRHRTMIEQSPLSIQILSPDGYTLRVNKAWENLWGLKLEHLTGYNMLHDKQLEELGILQYVRKGFEGEASVIPAAKYEAEKTIKNVRAAPARWVRAFIYPVKDDDGVIQEVVLIHEDITTQKENEEQLRQSEERFRTLIEQSTDAIQLVDPEGKILYTSASIKNVLGYTAEELDGLGVTPFLHPDDLSHFFNKFQELLQKPGGQVMLQYRVKHKDGSWAWLETTGVNHLETPHIHALVGTFRNITERRKHEEELRYQKTLLEVQQEVTPAGILVVSPKGQIVSYNKRFIELWKFSRELINAGDDQVALQNATQQLVDPEGFVRRVEQIYSSKEASHEEIYFKDGRVFDRYGSSLTGDDGTYYGYVWFFQDITERKNLERQKDDFIGVAGHELRTPVTSIKAYTQVLHRNFVKEGNTKFAQQLSKVDLQINKLTNLIGDLLDATKIESDKLRFHKTDFDFNELILEVCEEVQHTTDKHTIEIQLDKTKKIYSDRDRLGQVLANLLSNAVKYSPYSDKIIIKSSVSRKNITVSVQDFGIGITGDDKDRVFERFYRVEEGINQRTYAGLGLGLYISAEIVRRLGGKIWLESEKDKGSTFYFTLPL